MQIGQEGWMGSSGYFWGYTLFGGLGCFRVGVILYFTASAIALKFKFSIISERYTEFGSDFAPMIIVVGNCLNHGEIEVALDAQRHTTAEEASWLDRPH